MTQANTDQSQEDADNHKTNLGKRYSFCIKKTSHEATLFEDTYCDQILNVIRSTPEDCRNLQSVGFLRRGTDEQSAVPTITIVLAEEASPSMKSRLATLELSVPLEYLSGRITRG